MVTYYALYLTEVLIMLPNIRVVYLELDTKFRIANDQVASGCRAAYCHPNNIRSLKPVLVVPNVRVVQVLVISRIDYYNSAKSDV